MKILVIGSGGREHALVWKLRQSPAVETIWCAPGNGGIAGEAVCISPNISAPGDWSRLAVELGADLTVVGPEAPLVDGIADEFQAKSLLLAGPCRAAARLEGSKIFAKQFLRRHRIPTADFVVAEDVAAARNAIDRWGGPAVIKADGLAAGKGVVVCGDRSESLAAVEEVLSGKLVGDAGRRAVLEQRLQGEEVSFLVLTDGKTAAPLAPTQDHKQAFDGDQGPNTGGMGAYCDDGILSDGLRRRILREIVEPTLEGLRADGMVYRGVLYCGLMITPDGPQVLEFNVRFGDPETQALMFRWSGDLAETLLALARGELREEMVAWKPGASVCVVACSEGYPGAYPSGRIISGLAQAEGGGAKVFHAGTTLRDGAIATSGGRVLGITAVGAGLQSAVDIAYQAAASIRFEGMHYRRDIGSKGLLRSQPL